MQIYTGKLIFVKVIKNLYFSWLLHYIAFLEVWNKENCFMFK